MAKAPVLSGAAPLLGSDSSYSHDHGIDAFFYPSRRRPSVSAMYGIQREVRAQEGMELQGQGRGLCISFSWLVNDKTLIGETAANSEALQMSQGMHFTQCHAISPGLQPAEA